FQGDTISLDQDVSTYQILNPETRGIILVSRVRVPIVGPVSSARSPSRGGGYSPMNRLSLFNSPLLLGFDHFERALDRVAKSSADGYPPYNIEQIGDDRLR